MKLKVWIVLGGAFFCAASAGVWSEPELIGSESNAKLFVNNDGICWCDIHPDLYSYRGDISGWVFETTVPFPGIPYFDSADTLWAIGALLGKGIQYVRYDGESWSEPETIPTYTKIDDGGILTVDSADGVWVVWVTPWFDYQAVGYTRYLNGSWGEPQILTDTLEEVDHLWASITTDALGGVWIGWLELDWYAKPDTGASHVKAMRWDGEAWSDEMVIATYYRNQASSPTLTPDKKGGMWAVWLHEPDAGAQIITKSRHWDGAEWSPVDTVAIAGKDGLCFPEGGEAVDLEDNVWSIWRQAVEPNDTSGDIYFSVNQGDGWCRPSPVYKAPSFDFNPDIAIDGAGRIWCTWCSVFDGEYHIYASYATEVGVEEPLQSPKTEIISVQPSIMRSRATVSYSVGGKPASKTSENLELSVFDITGREVKALATGEHTPGYYTATWDGKDKYGVNLSSGVYFVRMSTHDFSANERIILLR